VKLTARIAATFSRSDAARVEAVGDAVTPAVPRDSKGTSAPSLAPIRRGLVVLVLALTGLAVAASSALAATPVLKLDPTAAADYTSVEVSGEINPEGDSVFWYLEFSSDGGASWQEGFSFPGESPSGELEGSTPQPLTGLVQKGLAPGTTYKVRLALYDYTTNEVVTSPEPSPEFTTKSLPAPTVTINPVSAPTASTAHFSGKITPNSPAGDPQAAEVTWHFVCEPSCPADEGEQTVSASAGETEVELDAGELQPSTNYEVRLIGKNAGDPVTAGPVSFQTEALPTPTITLDPITTFADTTATFVGHIDPNKPATGEAAASAVQWSVQCEPECPGLTGGTVPGAATGSERDIEVHATGLEPNTKYTVTLTGSNRGGPVSAAPETFSTIEVPATVGVGPGGAIAVGGYRLEGTVNPHNSVITECLFEWGPDTNYGHSAPCEPPPGSGNKVSFVTTSLAGLTVGAEYHFRLVAANATGPVHTSDEVFVAHEPCPNEAIREEQGSTYLPECRAYEQVTPVFKEAFPPGLTAFGNGEVTYGTSGNYADNGNGTATLNGGNAYLSARTGTGWSVKSLAPSGPDYYTYVHSPDSLPKATSSDLGSTLWEMRRGDQTNAVTDFYVRHPDGVFTRIGSALDPLSPVTAGGAVLASNDLTHFVFAPAITNSVGVDGIYEYAGTGEDQPRRVDVDNTGQPIAPGCVTPPGGGAGDYHAISTDGRVIFFTKRCAQSAVYARINGTTTVDVSEPQCTRVCSEGSEPIFQGADADGTRVYFSTTAQLVDGDTDETNDLYSCDIPVDTPAPIGAVNPCPELREVSGAAAGADVQGVTRISGDGSRIYFVATGVLASNPGANNESAVAGDDNLYLFTRDASHPAGETQFVAKLDQADGPTTVSGGLWGSDITGRLAQTTNDGRYLVFATYAALIQHGRQADTDTARDIYRYDAVTGGLVRLSTDTDGGGGNEPGQDARFTPIGYGNENARSVPYDRTAMDDDGGSVVFTTDEALAPGDTNGTVDTYLWHDGRVSLISSGKASQDEFFTSEGDPPLGSGNGVQPMISPSGGDVYFTTTARLVSSDTDTVMDLYDARIDGGFESSENTQCVGESCRVPASPASASQSPATQTPGAGNQPKPCQKEKVKKRGRCVKKHGKKHHPAHKHRHSAKHHPPAKHRSATNKGGRK
jgi:hypothetical protein